MGEPACELPGDEPVDQLQQRIEILQIQRAGAWFDYRDQISGLAPDVYEEVEPWAHALLKQRESRIMAWLEALGGPAAFAEN